MKLTPVLAATLLSILATLTIALKESHAHGEAKEVFRGSNDKYGIVVNVLPKTPMVGIVHFTIEPVETTTGQPMTDTHVVLIARLGNAAFQSTAVNTPTDPFRYDANITFYAPGVWDIEIGIGKNPKPNDYLSFSMHISDASIIRSPAAGIVYVFVFLAITAGAIYLWITSSKRLN